VEFLEADGRHERGVRSCVKSVCAGRMNGEVCWSKCCGDRVMRSRYGERNRDNGLLLLSVCLGTVRR
jgi:hypothetical protein